MKNGHINFSHLPINPIKLYIVNALSKSQWVNYWENHGL